MADLMKKKAKTFDALEAYLTTAPETKNIDAPILGEGKIKQVFRRVSTIFENKSYADRMREKLRRANINLKGSEFVTLNIITSLGPFLLVAFTGQLILALFCGIIGFFVPHMYVNAVQRKLTKAFNAQLADALILISNSLKSGCSILQAMENVSAEMPAPISDEFYYVIKNINFGDSFENALVSMNKKMEIEDLDLIVTAILIARQTGGSLANVLDKIAETIRERNKIKGEIRALTAQGRLSGLVIAMLPVGLGLLMCVIANGYITELFHHPIGLGLIAYGVISQGIGAFFINKVVQVEV